jgi:LysR family transcriptional regulator for bpeEF and oprC
MNQLLSIRCFARVVETGSFTRAADSLEMPKATVSKLVQDLEAYLGVLLLQRTTRKVAITADGNAYYERTARLIRELEDIDLSFSGDHKKPRGKIRVDIGGLPARMIVIPALPGFFARYPGMQIDFGVGDRNVDLVGDNVDCVVRGGPMTELSLVSRLLGTASWTTCATAAYLLANGTPQHPRDIKSGHRIVSYHSALSGRAIPGVFEKKSERIEVDGPYTVSVNDGNARLAAGLAGLGILQTFTYAIRSELQAKTLVPILAGWAPTRYPFHVVYPPNRNLSNRVRVFIDWLVEIFEALD